MKAKLQHVAAENKMLFVKLPPRRKPARTAEEKRMRKAELQRDRQRLHRERAKNGGSDLEVSAVPLSITHVPPCNDCGKRLIDCECPAEGIVSGLSNAVSNCTVIPEKEG